MSRTSNYLKLHKTPTSTPAIQLPIKTPCATKEAATTATPIPTSPAGEAQQRKRNQSKRNRKDSSSEISVKNSASEEASPSLFPTVSSSISTTSTTATGHGALSAATALSTATLPFISSPTSGASDASTSSTEQRSVLLAIILPIILILIILMACCFYRKRIMNAADNVIASEPKPSSTPISPLVPAIAAAAIGIRRRSISSLSYTTESNDQSQFSHSTSSKEMLPREALPFTAATFAAQSVHSSSQAQSIYSLYGGNSNSADSFMTDDLLKFGAGAAALAANESHYSSSSSSSKSEKSVSERRRVGEGDYVADDAFHRASLVPSANSFVDMAPAVELDSQSDTKCNENSSNVSYDLPSKKTPLLTEQVPSTISTSLLALPEHSEDEEKENKELNSKGDKKAAFPIELKETVRGRFELSQHPRWMRKPQFVNPNTTPDFSSSIDGAHNQFDDDEFDLDDYVPPAPTSHVAIMNYAPKRKEEMRIANGDLIGIERQLSGEWCLGQNISQQRKRGLFPLSAVVAIKSGPSQAVRRGRFGAGSAMGK